MKKLDELFNLPASVEEEPEEEGNIILELSKEPVIDDQTLMNIEKIEKALPMVTGLEASDDEMDELAKIAVEGYRDISDLAMQVDGRYSSELFSAASNLLGHAITAKTNKMQKKLKMIELQLKKMALDQKASMKEKEIENIPAGEAKTFDRNDLLRVFAVKPEKKDK